MDDNRSGPAIIFMLLGIAMAWVVVAESQNPAEIIIQMCEPVDAVRACQDESLQCEESYDPEFFTPERKSTR